MYCHLKRKGKVNSDEEKKYNRKHSRLQGISIRLLQTAKLIGVQYAKGIKLHDDVIYKNVDLMLIVFIGFLLIIFGILGGVSFYVLFILKPDLVWVHIILIYLLVGFIMVAVSGWALIPSSLTSRFPVYFRATASNLAYNGGLAIGFASPFIMLENFLTYKSEWLIFFPVILGASAMILGATRFINDMNKQSRGFNYEKLKGDDGTLR
jgi:hypothetical protein